MTARAIRTNPVTDRSGLVLKALHALSRDLPIEATVYRGATVRGRLRAVENKHRMQLEEKDGGSTMVMCFTTGEEVPLEHVTAIKRVSA